MLASAPTELEGVDLDRLLLQVEAEQCSRSLGRFIRDGWPVLEPTTDYVHGWHIDAIVEHLEAVTAGELTRLLVNVPPRFMKSIATSVCWPAWSWTHDPSTRWLFASYTQPLSTRDSVKCRRLIQGRWYQERWGHLFGLTSDQNVKTRFENDATGYRLATSVDGSATGEGGDIIVADDPHNVKEAESQTKREGVLVWWDEVMSTRLNDPETGAKVIIMQRVHENDLSGHVLQQGGWEHLLVPMEYDPKRAKVTSVGFQDPRAKEGDLAWPARFPRATVEDLKVSLGPYGTAGQLQQHAVARSGGMFEREWFGVVKRVPPGVDLEWVAYCDKAGTEGGGKRTCLILMGRNQETGECYVRDRISGQWHAGTREARIDDACKLWAGWLGGKRAFTFWVEQEPGSGGKESAELTVRRLTIAGYRADREPATGDKFARADGFSGAAKAGLVKLVEGDWNEAYKRALESSGPGAEYLDDMDASSGAYNRLALVEPQATEELVQVPGLETPEWMRM